MNTNLAEFKATVVPAQINFGGKEELMVRAKEVANILDQTKTVDNENQKEVKRLVAESTKVMKRIEDERKKIKKEIMSTYTEFEKDIKEVVNTINVSDVRVRELLKEFEEEVKRDKLVAVKSLFNVRIDNSSVASFITFNDVFDSKYLNATESLNKIDTSICEKIANYEMEYATIQSSKDALLESFYKDVKNLLQAFELSSQHKERASRVVEQSLQVTTPSKPSFKLWKFAVKSGMDAEFVKMLMNDNGIEFEEIGE